MTTRSKESTCSNAMVTRYHICNLLQPHLGPTAGPQRLTQNLRHIEVPRVEYEKLSDERLGEPSTVVQARVEAARERQRGRFGEHQLLCGGKPAEGVTTNAGMRSVKQLAEVRQHCKLDETCNTLMRRKPWFTVAMRQMPADV